ncbi:MAG: VOC family protein [Pseudomonadota bacterium]
MIAYVTIGADDMIRAKRFYAAFMPGLGYALEERSDGLSWTQPAQPGRTGAPVDLYIKAPFDGRPASVGNGVMIAFDAGSQDRVRALHAAALDAGGAEEGVVDEGGPGFRDAYGPHFYVGYLRDPQGNKIALFSDDPNEPGRDG